MHNEKNEDMENRYILSSVDSALSILNLFFDYEELSVNDVAKLINVSRSTAFRFMITLENRGFVAKTDNAKYRLGINMFSLGMIAYNRMELVSLIHPHLAELAKQSGETCHISILDDGMQVVFVDRALGTSLLKMDTALGYREYAHNTATGKAILAFQKEEIINQYIRRAKFSSSTPNSIKSGAALLEILEKIRFDGYACDNEEAELGLTCLAMPLLDRSGRAYAAISISGPTTRIAANRQAHIERLENMVEKIAKAIM